jgi:hypothetical protein
MLKADCEQRFSTSAMRAVVFSSIFWCAACIVFGAFLGMLASYDTMDICLVAARSSPDRGISCGART